MEGRGTTDAVCVGSSPTGGAIKTIYVGIINKGVE